jgi:hypothetical protein
LESKKKEKKTTALLELLESTTSLTPAKRLLTETILKALRLPDFSSTNKSILFQKKVKSIIKEKNLATRFSYIIMPFTLADTSTLTTERDDNLQNREQSRKILKSSA